MCIRDRVYTVLTHSLRLEAFINRYATIPVRRMKPQVAVVLMVSAAQLLWMDRIPPHAVVDEAVKLILASPQRNLSGFVNGVLRAMLRENLRESWPEAKEDMLAHLSVRYSIPRWILEMWEKTYGLEMTKRFARNLTTPRDLSLRCNTLRTDPETLYQDLVKELGEGNVGRGHVCAEALTCKKSGDISHWEAFRRGHVTVQDVYKRQAFLSERRVDRESEGRGQTTRIIIIEKEGRKEMLHPSYSELIEKVNEVNRSKGLSPINSRYSVVIAAARRARAIIAGDKPMVEARDSELGVLSRVVDEMDAGKIAIYVDEQDNSREHMKYDDMAVVDFSRDMEDEE